MKKIVKTVDEDFYNFKFDVGTYGVVLIESDNIGNNFLNIIFEHYERNLGGVYLISGFNLKPYLNLYDNVYDMLGIDLDIELENRSIFEYYCTIFEFNSFKNEFHFLSDFDKLKSMFLVALLSSYRVFLFYNFYSIDIDYYTKFIFDKIKQFNLINNKILIEIKKAS